MFLILNPLVQQNGSSQSLQDFINFGIYMWVHLHFDRKWFVYAFEIEKWVSVTTKIDLKFDSFLQRQQLGLKLLIISYLILQLNLSFFFSFCKNFGDFSPLIQHRKVTNQLRYNLKSILLQTQLYRIEILVVVVILLLKSLVLITVLHDWPETWFRKLINSKKKKKQLGCVKSILDWPCMGSFGVQMSKLSDVKCSVLNLESDQVQHEW